MQYSQEHIQRSERVMKWFAPARFGLFYHWGLFTGGGDTSLNPPKPLKYPDVASFEAAAPDPSAVAENMVANALLCGAKYITLTLLHCGDGCFLIYPSALKGLRFRATKDYAGAFLDAACKHGIQPLFYIPLDGVHPYGIEEVSGFERWSKTLELLVDELKARYADRISGFWLDGMAPQFQHIPAHIRARFPDAIIINNNCTALDIPCVDFGTTEFVTPDMVPSYNRPSSINSRTRHCLTLPGRDFNEDIPTPNGWWVKPGAWGELRHFADPYLKDKRYLLRQMLSSLGQRGQWNFAWGVGPLIDGTIPCEFMPSLRTVAEFFKWGAEAIYNTTGGEDSQIKPGFFNAAWAPEGFCSVTRRLDAPDTYYVLVTDAPPVNRAMFHTKGAVPKRVSDLRTGKELPFSMAAGVVLDGLDWSDVAEYGVKAFKIEF